MSNPAILDEAELQEFLSEKLLAKIATLRSDGSPQITPVWFDFDGTFLYISTTSDTAKVRNIQRDNRVAICIESKSGGKAVLFEGTAAINSVYEARRRSIIAKYVPSEERDGFLARRLPNQVIIKVKPKKTISWDYSRLQ